VTRHSILHPEVVIVLCPREALNLALTPAGLELALVFHNGTDFDEWREASTSEPSTLVEEVAAVLDDVAADRARCSSTTRKALDFVAHQAVAPPLQALISAVGSRSSLYREWNLTVTPADFLRRVRARHACRLIAERALPRKVGAHIAGYTSSGQLRRHLRRIERTRRVSCR
jgi:AraC-like DNA-binding protein